MACFSVSLKLVVACNEAVKVEGLKPSVLWHAEHSPPSGRPANWPLCGSFRWQSSHRPWETGILKLLDR